MGSNQERAESGAAALAGDVEGDDGGVTRHADVPFDPGGGARGTFTPVGPPQRATRSVRRAEWDLAVAALASRQHGAVDRSQLRALGLTDEAIRHRARTGRLHVLWPGVYLVGHTAEGPRTRPKAALLASGPHAVLARRTARALHGMGAMPAGTVDVALRRGKRRPRPGIDLSRSGIPAHHVWQGDGLRLTSPAWTVVELAPVLPRRELLRCVDEGRGQGVLTLEALDEALTEARGRRGTAQLRSLVDEEPPLSESAA